MCLISKGRRFRKMIAKRDLVAYKQVIFSCEPDIIAITPVFFFRLKLGINYPTEKYVNRKKSLPWSWREIEIIKEGVFHCFRERNRSTNMKLTIPEGTEYYVGINGQIAARCIRIDENWQIK